MNSYGNNVCGPTGAPGSVLTQVTIPDNEVVGHTYDVGGLEQIIRTSASTNNIVTSVTRNVRGQTFSVVYGNGVQQYHCYNDGVMCNGVPQTNTDQRVNEIVVLGNAWTQDYKYLFDSNDNVTSVQDVTEAAKSWIYGYDSADRLTSAVLNGTTYGYAYDDAGNLTSKEGGAQTYPVQGAGSVHPHAVSTAAGLSYGYDVNGNLASRSDGLAVLWNGQDMVTHEAGGAATSATQRWFLGESVWKKTQGANTYYYLPGMRVENGVARKFYGHFGSSRRMGPSSTTRTTISGAHRS